MTVENPTSGSHFKFRRPGHRVYTVTAHNGEQSEISDKYVKGLCRGLSLDFDALKKLL